MSKEKHNSNQKVLFILKTSKSTKNGLYQMNQYVAQSKLIHTFFQTQIIKLSATNSDFILLKYTEAIFKTCRSFFEILYSLKTFKPDIVYFVISPVNSFIRDFLYIILLKLFRIKVIYHLHGKGIKKKAKQCRLYNKLYKLVYKDSYLIIISKKLKYDIDFLPFKELFILPNCTDYIDEKFVKKDYSLINKNPRIIFLSNLIISKGVYEFINACKMILNEGIEIEAIIVGAEAEIKKAEIESALKNFKKTIHYVGPKYGNDKYEYLHSSDIFVFPTYYSVETWGIVITEAMQVGLPVITTDEAAISDMINNGKNGYIVEKKNSKELADKIKKILFDPQKRKEMGMANRDKYLKNYTHEIFEKRLLDIITAVAK